MSATKNTSMRVPAKQHAEIEQFIKDKGFAGTTAFFLRAAECYMESVDLSGPKFAADLLRFYADKIESLDDKP